MANSRTNFEYHVPSDLKEALYLMELYSDSCRCVAGGTDLIPKVKAGILQFDHLISLKNLDELRYTEKKEDGSFVIGSLVTLKELENNRVVREQYPALYEGIHSMANTQIRNRGTVTGNICNAVPSADTAPALLVYGAKVEIESAEAKRTVPIEGFFTGVCRTVLQPNEVATRLILPEPEKDAFSVYYKYSIRKALDLAMVGVALNITLDEERTVRAVKAALGAVAATPRRAGKMEELLIGRVLTEERIREAAVTASEEDCSPISDIRASAAYRREMVRVHMTYALRKAVEGR